MRWLMALLGPVDESEVDETPRSLRLWGRGEAVSYTHLTLPTIYPV